MTPQNKARLIAAVAAPLFLFHAFPGRCEPLPAPAASASAPTQMEHISVTAIGRGSPVILIPGLSTPRAVWDGVVPALARTHRVHVIQVNGFGGDDPRANLRPGALEGVAGDLHAYMAREKIAGAAVVGHSMGGLVALMLAKEHGGDVGKLMVVDALPFIGSLFSHDASRSRGGSTPEGNDLGWLRCGDEAEFATAFQPPSLNTFRALASAATVALVEPQARTMRDQMAAGFGKPANPAIAQATAHQLAAKPASQALVADWVGHADRASPARRSTKT